MENAYEIIHRINRALWDSLKADPKDYAVQRAVMETLHEALRDTMALVEDATATLSVHEAVVLVNNLTAVCKHCKRVS